MVRSAYGRTADDCLSVADQLLVKKVSGYNPFIKLPIEQKNPHHSQMVGVFSVLISSLLSQICSWTLPSYQ